MRPHPSHACLSLLPTLPILPPVSSRVHLPPFRSSPEYTQRIIKLALDTANGMKYVSSLGILHVDLKAENVLLQKAQDGVETAGTGMVAKVADFGLAQVCRASRGGGGRCP